jgi:hypothetical protein
MAKDAPGLAEEMIDLQRCSDLCGFWDESSAHDSARTTECTMTDNRSDTHGRAHRKRPRGESDGRSEPVTAHEN